MILLGRVCDKDFYSHFPAGTFTHWMLSDTGPIKVRFFNRPGFIISNLRDDANRTDCYRFIFKMFLKF